MEMNFDYLSFLSHELRNPLNSIINIIELANKSVTDKEKTKLYLEKLKNISHFMLSLNDYYFEFYQMKCKSHLTTREEFDLDDFIDEIHSLFEDQFDFKKQKLTVLKKGFNHQYLIGDTLRLKQIMINLLANANKYTPAGGTVKFSCAAEEDDSAVSVRFIVEDNGIGMSKKFMKKIYEPYSQEQNDNIGCGLGMSIVKQIVDLMGGTIDIRSGVGKGTTVTVSLRFPITDAGNSYCDCHFNNHRFLLVDDSPINLELLTAFIKEKKGIAETATDGKAALRKFLSSPENYYQMIIADVRMPQLDGISLARRIRKADRSDAAAVPIVVISAGVCNDRLPDETKRIINGYLSKPIDAKKLYQVIGKLLFKN